MLSNFQTGETTGTLKLHISKSSNNFHAIALDGSYMKGGLLYNKFQTINVYSGEKKNRVKAL